MAEGNKTEQPTPRRRLKAREQGQVARSRDLSNAVATMTGLLVFAAQLNSNAANWSQYSRQALTLAASGEIRMESEIFARTAWLVLRCSLVPMGSAWLAATTVALAQGGFVFAPAALAFKPSRLSPAAKLQQMFSTTGLSSLLKSLLPAGVILYLAVQTLSRDWQMLLYSMRWNVRQFLAFLLGRVFEICWKSMLALLIWAAVDYLLVRQKHESELRMSREEIREEMKQTEGNPAVKGRLQRLRRQARRKQMMRDVRRASVVVVNPTHFAVALEYGPQLSAPLVVAKGRNLLAEQIKQEARWHGIAVMENPPLAQALYRTVQIGQPIPAKLYAAVAEILAFVYRMQTEAARARENHRAR